MTITNIFTMEHDKYLLHWANFVPEAMGQNRSESILSPNCSEDKFHALLSVFAALQKKNHHGPRCFL